VIMGVAFLGAVMCAEEAGRFKPSAGLAEMRRPQGFALRPLTHRWAYLARLIACVYCLALVRRTALILPLGPPPQKNRSRPSDSSPEMPVPGRHLE